MSVIQPPRPRATREAWLLQLADLLRPWFRANGLTIPEKLRATISLTPRRRVVGVCYAPEASRDGSTEILVRIDQDDPMHVAGILGHELVHASVGVAAGHGKVFRRAATAIGLTGKMTATIPGPLFVAEVAPLISSLGPFPHAALSFDRPHSGPRKQSTRYLKAACEACGYSVRVTRRWLDVGPPYCPALEHGPMAEADADEGEAEP